MVTQPRLDRVHSLDSLRGLAAIYVVFFHLVLLPTPNLVIPDNVAAQIVSFGGTGVFLFFVISGFSLSMTMPRHDRTGFPLVSYGVSRLFRIAPMFVFMLIVSILRDRLSFGALPSARNVVLNLSFLFNLVPGHQEGIIWASWTVGVEMLFYAAFPILYRMGVRTQISVGIVALLLFTATESYAPIYFYWSVLGWFPLFIIGMVAFETYDVLKLSSRRRHVGLALIITGLAVLAACIAVPGAGGDVRFRTPIGIGYAALLVGCVLRNPSVLEAKPLMFFGRISYPLYLIHAPIIFRGSGFFLRVTTHVPDSVSYVACAVVTFAVATPCAYLAHILVEKPGIDAGRRILRLLAQRRNMRLSKVA